jgi:hypothetical protein
MKFGVLHEPRLPRRWTGDSEHTLFKGALDQVERERSAAADTLNNISRGLA